MIKKLSTPYILTIAVCIALLVPLTLQDGMFMDGLIYATISKNLANGLGSFWFPLFSITDTTTYHDQLPLFFGLQAVFFKIFGNSIYTERIFSLVMALCTAVLIVGIWRLLFKNENGAKQLEWLPVMFWVIIPITFWSFSNNVEEVLMTPLALASVYFILKGLLNGNVYLNITIGGLFIFLCSFCKGFQGLFMLTTIAWYFVFIRKITLKQAFYYSALLISIPVIIYSLLMFNEDASKSIMLNLSTRLGRTFSDGTVATTTARFYLVIRLFTEMIPSILIALIFYVIARYKKISINKKTNSFAFVFLVIGLSGSLPLLVTLEQRGFYLCTTLPFFALSLAIFVKPYVVMLAIENIKTYKAYKYFSLFLLCFAIAFSFYSIGKTKRDKEMLSDIKKVAKYIPSNSVIGVPFKMREEYALKAYFNRKYNIFWDIKDINREFYFTYNNSSEHLPNNYIKLNIGLVKYNLYKRIK